MPIPVEQKVLPRPLTMLCLMPTEGVDHQHLFALCKVGSIMMWTVHLQANELWFAARTLYKWMVPFLSLFWCGCQCRSTVYHDRPRMGRLEVWRGRRTSGVWNLLQPFVPLRGWWSLLSACLTCGHKIAVLNRNVFIN